MSHRNRIIKYSVLFVYLISCKKYFDFEKLLSNFKVDETSKSIQRT